MVEITSHNTNIKVRDIKKIAIYEVLGIHVTMKNGTIYKYKLKEVQGG